MPSPRFTLRQLEIFLAVAQTGSVTRAAEVLHLSPSATSAAMTELERSLGIELTVRRKGRGVQLTAEGRMFEGLANRLLDDVSEMTTALTDSSTGTVGGTLRVGCFTSLSPIVLPSLVHTFSIRYPSVTIELVEDMEYNLRKMVLDGALDVMLGYERPTHPELRCVHLASRRPYVIVPPDHRFADRESVALSELIDDPLVLISVGPGDERILSWFTAAGITPHIGWVARDIDLARALVGRGLGYAALMQRRDQDDSLEGLEVRRLEVDPPVDPVDVYLIHGQAGSRANRVQAFIELAVEKHRDLPEWTGFTPPAPAPA